MKKRKSMFTLIELLMVIGVIGILAAILLPALLNARRKAKLVSCINRQKQIAASFQLYASDYDEFAYGGPEWAVAMLPEASVVKPYRDAGKIEWAGAPAGQGYLRSEEMLFCPEEQVSNLTGAAAYGKDLGEEYPFKFTTLGTVRNPDQSSLPIPMKNFISPSSSVLGGDCGAISDSEYRHFSGMLSTDDPYITMRHKNIANVFLADGHVSSAGKDLKDYYFYNVRGSSHKDDKYTMAVKKGLKYELE